ncbi:MAG: T9SS C-terminal target domain-containing protein [Chitinophagaceae bacterium]|nr:MAG: T9SS C-terminal target domain-containing protein [Chitinophagaceae bacterium]
MVKLQFLLICMLTIFSLNAMDQDWAPHGTTWHYGPFWVEPTPADCYTYSTMTSIGDTVINGQESRILEIQNFHGDNNWEGYHFLYKEDNRIYHYADDLDSFYVLYDFNLQVGDTLLIREDFPVYYDEGGITDNLRFEIVVDSLSFRVVNGDRLIEQFTKPVFIDGQIYPFSYVVESNNMNPFRIPVVENIGSLQIFFGVQYYTFIVGCVGGIRCYESPDFFYEAPGIDSCAISSSEDILMPQFKLKFYPNPASDYITINIPEELQNVTVEIYDVQSRKVFSQKVSQEKSIITLDGLTSGVFLVTVLQNGQVLTRERLVVLQH